MAAEDTGPTTLQGLAQRLEALEHENAELRHKVATLEGSSTRCSEVPALRGSDAGCSAEQPVANEFAGQVRRRDLLSKAGAAAVGTVAAGALLLRDKREARAHDLTNLIEPYAVLTHYVEALNHEDTIRPALYGQITEVSTSAVLGENLGSAPGVRGTNEGAGPAVEGEAHGSGGTGVQGTGRYGVWGESNQAGFYGVLGRNINGTGVRGVGGEIGVVGKGKNGIYGESSTPGDWAAVVGRNTAQGVGVHGESLTGYGVRGVGTVGVHGRSSEANWGSVWGEHTGAGYGVSGTAKGSSTAGVLGRNPSGYGGSSRVARRSLGSCLEAPLAGLPPDLTSRARCTWTRRGRCSCAWPAAPRARGRRSRRPQPEGCIPSSVAPSQIFLHAHYPSGSLGGSASSASKARSGTVADSTRSPRV